jgi:hypothetical protein
MTDHSNLPISEQYRLVSKQWVKADAAASLLERCRSAFRSQLVAKLMDSDPKLSETRATRMANGSTEWADYQKKITDTREEANLLKVKLEWVRMRYGEAQSYEATKRAEMKL